MVLLNYKYPGFLFILSFTFPYVFPLNVNASIYKEYDGSSMQKLQDHIKILREVLPLQDDSEKIQSFKQLFRPVLASINTTLLLESQTMNPPESTAPEPTTEIVMPRDSSIAVEERFPDAQAQLMTELETASSSEMKPNWVTQTVTRYISSAPSSTLTAYQESIAHVTSDHRNVVSVEQYNNLIRLLEQIQRGMSRKQEPNPTEINVPDGRKEMIAKETEQWRKIEQEREEQKMLEKLQREKEEQLLNQEAQLRKQEEEQKMQVEKEIHRRVWEELNKLNIQLAIEKIVNSNKDEIPGTLTTQIPSQSETPITSLISHEPTASTFSQTASTSVLQARPKSGAIKNILNQKGPSYRVSLKPQFNYHDRDPKIGPGQSLIYAKPKEAPDLEPIKSDNSTSSVEYGSSPTTLTEEPIHGHGGLEKLSGEDTLEYLQRIYPELSKIIGQGSNIEATYANISSSSPRLQEPKETDPINILHMPKDIQKQHNPFSTFNSKEDLRNSYLKEQNKKGMRKSNIEQAAVSHSMATSTKPNFMDIEKEFGSLDKSPKDSHRKRKPHKKHSFRLFGIKVKESSAVPSVPSLTSSPSSMVAAIVLVGACLFLL